MPDARTLQVSPSQAERALTPAQKRFNTLIAQIQRARQSISAWHQAVPAFRLAHEEQLAPLRAQRLAGIREWAFGLDRTLELRTWTADQRDLLCDLVCEAVGELIECGDEDPALQALFDKHVEVQSDQERLQQLQEAKDMAQLITGLDLGEEEISSNEDLLARLQRRMAEEDAEARRALGESPQPEAAEPPRRQTAADKRKALLAQQATQSVREIYRKLASALHPDREPDPAQRQIKTAMMQRVNRAYEASDLLALLELQLEIEQIDAGHLANVGAERLLHYNKVLAEQLKELKAEVDHLEFDFCMEFRVFSRTRPNPAKLVKVLDDLRRQWLIDLDVQRRDMQILGNVPATKRWLKGYRIRRMHEELQFPPF